MIKDVFDSKKQIASGLASFNSTSRKDISLDEKRLNSFIYSTFKDYSPFKLAQRLIAFTVLYVYVFAWFFTFAASFFISVDMQIKMLSDTTLGMIVLSVASFYFGGGAIEGIVAKLSLWRRK